MSRGTARRLWQEVHGEPYSPSDKAEVEPSPMDECQEPCGWCTPVYHPCAAMRRAMARRAYTSASTGQVENAAVTPDPRAIQRGKKE